MSKRLLCVAATVGLIGGEIGHRLVLDPLPTFGNVTSCKRTEYFQFKRLGLKTHLWHDDVGEN